MFCKFDKRNAGRFGILALFSAVLSLVSPSANASLINFGFETTSGTPFIIGGQLTISNTPDAVGGFDILSITGAVGFGSGVILIPEIITGLVSNPNQPNPTDNGSWIYDNVGFPGHPHLDVNGILFSAGGYFYNIYSNDPLNSGGNEKDITGYILSTNNPFGIFNPGQDGTLFTQEVGAVPELSTWAMMLLGFAGIGFVAYRRAKKTAAIAA